MSKSTKPDGASVVLPARLDELLEAFEDAVYACGDAAQFTGADNSDLHDKREAARLALREHLHEMHSAHMRISRAVLRART